jgi:hypothetical protein
MLSLLRPWNIMKNFQVLNAINWIQLNLESLSYVKFLSKGLIEIHFILIFFDEMKNF